MKIGIIGTCNIAEAMVKIFLKNRVVSASEVMVFDSSNETLNYWAGTYDILPCENVENVVQNCQMVFITASGNALPKLITSMDVLLRTHRPLVVSLATGKSLEEIEDMMEFIPPMARVLTNLNIESGAGITACCFNELVTEDLKGTLIEMLSVTGVLLEIDESEFDAFSVISALSSAFACSLIETLANCGINEGLNRTDAYKTSLQCISGTAKVLHDSGMSVGEYLTKLSTPKSLVTEALLELKANGFDKAVINGYRAAEKGRD